jgi:hypothetical protein
MPNVNNDKAVKPSSSGKSAASNPSQSASERERDVDVFHALATNPDLKFNFHPKLTSWRFELAVLKASLTKENPDASRLVKIFTTMRDELLNITMRRPLIAEGIRSAMSDERLNALVPTRSEVDYGKTQVALLAALNHMGEIGNDQVSQNIQGKISELTARIQKKDAPIEVMFDALLFAFAQLRLLREAHNEDVSRRGNPFAELLAIDTEKDYYYGGDTFPRDKLFSTQQWVADVMREPETFGLGTSELNSVNASKHLQNAALAHWLCGPNPLWSGSLPDTLLRDFDQLSKLRGDCERLTRSSVATSIFQFLLKECGVTATKDQMANLQFALGNLLCKDNTGPDDISALVLESAEHICNQEDIELSESQKKTYKSMVDKSMMNDDPIFRVRSKGIGAILYAKLNNDVGTAKLIEQKGMTAFAEQIEAVAKHLSRIGRVYHGVHGETLQRMIIQRQQQDLAHGMITGKYKTEDDLPTFFSSHFGEVEKLSQEFEQIKAKIKKAAPSEEDFRFAFEPLETAYVDLSEANVEEELSESSLLKPFAKEIHAHFLNAMNIVSAFGAARRQLDKQSGISQVSFPLRSGFNLVR